MDVKFIFNLTWLINMIALLILRIHNYTSIQWHFILCIGNASYDCSQVICELRYVIMQLVHLAGHSSMNLRNRQPKNTDLPPSRREPIPSGYWVFHFITFLHSLLFCLLHHEFMTLPWFLCILCLPSFNWRTIFYLHSLFLGLDIRVLQW